MCSECKLPEGRSSVIFYSVFPEKCTTHRSCSTNRKETNKGRRSLQTTDPVTSWLPLFRQKTTKVRKLAWTQAGAEARCADYTPSPPYLPPPLTARTAFPTSCASRN